MRRWVDGRRWKAIVSTTVLVLGSGTLVALAATSRSHPVVRAELHDGGIWVTGRSPYPLVGQVNPEIRQSVRAVFPAGPSEVVQDGGTALLLTGDVKRRLLTRVDVPSGRILEGGAKLPEGATVAAGGGTVAVLGGDGRLWLRTPDTPNTTAFDAAAAVGSFGPGAAVAVGQDGVVHLASPARGKLLSYTAGKESGSTDLAAEKGSAVTVTTVGRSAAVLVDGRAVQVDDGDPVRLPEGVTGAVLQQPGPAADQVVLAGDRELVDVPLGGGRATVVTTGGAGEPAAPVQVGGCRYALWNAQPRVRAVACLHGEPDLKPVGSPAAKGPLVLRVNHDRLVINDTDSGEVYSIDDPQTNLARWEPLRQKDKQDQKQSKQTREQAASDRQRPNRPPIAKDDVLGARPGVPILLPVLDNDSDPDGDLLTLELPKDNPTLKGFGTVEPVDSGRGLQVLPQATASGSVQFKYVVRDGRGGEARATVTLAVAPVARNRPPVLVRTDGGARAPRLMVRAGGSGSYDVLQDWRDPDGDPLTLRCAGRPDPNLTCTPDGVVSVRTTATPGDLTVPLTVTDGRDEARGSLLVHRVAEGSLPPVARPDFGTALAGVPATLAPLANDTGFGAGPPLLGAVRSAGAATFTVADDGTLTMTARNPGAAYATYTISSGGRNATGVIRVDVTAPDGDHAPSAAPDSAVVRPGVPVDVDVLANDSDPDGDVLVVTGIQGDADADTAVRAQVLTHRTIRLLAAEAMPETLGLTYTVTDGVHQAQGRLLLRRAPADSQDLAPVARDDRAVTRAGQVVTVPVMQNDSDPEGEPLTLDPTPVDVGFRPNGSATVEHAVVAFGAGSGIRLVAPAKAGVITLTYTVRDATGQPSSAFLTVQVNPVDGPNSPPRPAAVTVAAIAGRPSIVLVPLAGTDPDGDQVSLVAPVDQPRQGVVLRSVARRDALVYTPRAQAKGTDTFHYQVVDARGLTATGVVQVGVAPPPGTAQPPVALDDSLMVRNNRARTVRLAALANDSSPSGDPLAFADALTPLGAGSRGRIEGAAVEVTLPEKAAAPAVLAYRVEAAGVPAAAPGTVRVTPSPVAPLLPPVAKDDLARAAGPGRTVDVRVLANDADPDASSAELTVPADATGGLPSVGPADLATRVDERTVRVRPGGTARWAWYTVRDADGQLSRGLILVEGTDGPPHLKDGAPPLVLRQGQSRTVPLADYLVAPSGRPVRVAQLDHLTASGLTAASRSEGTALALTADRDVTAGAISVEVTDGASVSDPAGRKAFVTLPVTIDSGGDDVPAFHPQLVSVAKGEDAVRVDLERATTDDRADAGHHNFTLAGGAHPGVSVSQSGAVLSLGADAGAVAGKTFVLGLTVSDGTHPPVPGTVTVKVLATTRPAPQATDCRPPAGSRISAGSSFTVDLAACSVNPFPGKPFRYTVMPADGVPATASADAAGKATVRVGPGFHGTLTVGYSVTDQLNRSTVGRIVAGVVDRPGPPGRPEVVGQPGDRAVVLRWTAAEPMGGTIIGYRVQDKGVDFPCEAITQCKVTGLSNDHLYNFRVVAVNEAGAGTPSDPVQARPDTLPDPPSRVTVKAQDRAVQLDWVGSSKGSAIDSYTVTVVSKDGTALRPQPGGVGARGALIDGLKNGTTYTFQLVAHNKAGDSAMTVSTEAIPAGAMGALPELAVKPTAATGDGGELDVTWDKATIERAANGQITSFVVNGLGDHAPIQVGDESAHFKVANNQTYQVSLTVKNNLDFSATSPVVTVTAEGLPSQAAWLDAPVAGDGAATVTFGEPKSNGLGLVSLRVLGGPAPVTVPLGGPFSVTVPGLRNGSPYRFRVEACNQTANSCSTSDPSAEVIPYGKPAIATPQATVNQLTVSFTWSAPDGNGSDVTDGRVAINGGGYSGSNCPTGPVTAAGSCQLTGTNGASYSITYSATNARGTTSATSAAVQAYLPRVVTIGHGPSASRPDCTDPSCAWVTVTIDHYAPNTIYNFRLTSQTGTFVSGGRDYGLMAITTDGNGHGSKQCNCFYGYSGTWVGTDDAGVQGVIGRIYW